MTNPSKDRGTRWETQVVNYLKLFGFPYSRRTALAGAQDKGDIYLGDDPPGGQVTTECKDHKQIALAEFVDEAIAEAKNAGTPLGVAIIKRRGRGVSQAYVVTTLEQWVQDRIRRSD